MEQLISAVMSQLMVHGVTVVFVATLLARLGAPIPASAVLVVAGGLIAADQLPLGSIVVAAILANLLGDAAWFYAGRFFGNRVMRLLCKISLSPDTCVRQSESLITRWGGSALIAAKFVPGVSVVAPPMAGALHMTLRRFLAFDLLAAAIWVAAFLIPGWLFSAQIEVVLEAITDASSLAMVVLLVAIAAALALRFWRRRNTLMAIGVPRIGIDELHTLMATDKPPLVIDVRSEATMHIDSRRIPGAINVHLQQLKSGKPLAELLQIADWPTDREIVLYCDCPNEVSAAMAAQLLAARGATSARPLAGGLEAWVASGRATTGVVPGLSVP
ncbi:VTT domain-containing protein [Variovorax sp. RHLX14]|uniref:VTT domain-containing protein n=1 Tax=Variovorax sp. RHLX14 TaxID=1259731 RepID=UPI003F466B07